MIPRRDVEEQDYKRRREDRPRSRDQGRTRSIQIDDTPPSRASEPPPLPNYLRTKESIQMDMKALLKFFRITKAEPPLFWKTNQ